MASGSATTRRRTPSPRRPCPSGAGLLRDWPHAILRASEDAVGLPAGQMGNSEVGHLNLGAGRPVLQDLPRIDAAIADGSFATRPALLAACRRAAEPGRRLHLVSLVGPGGVHANDRHLVEVARLAAAQGVAGVRVHALLDGRDTPPRSALGVHRRPRAAPPRGPSGRPDRIRRRPLLGHGPRQALGPGRARLRRDRPRGRGACGQRDRGRRGGLRPRRERRVRDPDGDRRRRRDRPARRRDRPLQLPRRPRPRADPCPGRPGVRGLRPRVAVGPAGARRPARGHDGRVRRRARRSRSPSRPSRLDRSRRPSRRPAGASSTWPRPRSTPT